MAIKESMLKEFNLEAVSFENFGTHQRKSNHPEKTGPVNIPSPLQSNYTAIVAEKYLAMRDVSGCWNSVRLTDVYG